MFFRQCNMTIQEYIFSAVIIGTIFAVVVLLIILFIKTICSLEQFWSQFNLTSYREKWKRIKYLSNKEDTRPLAIINACSLLDHVLKTKGYQGEKLNERLASAQIAIRKNEIWEILRLRNELAHDIDMKPLDKKKTIKYLQIIHQILFELNVFA